MSSYTLKADYSIHESGSKYYQVFLLVNNNNGKAIHLDHWGSYKVGISRAPKLHRKATQVSTASNTASASVSYKRKKNGKQARGYRKWEHYNSDLTSLQVYAALLDEWFDRNDVEIILSHLLNIQPHENFEDMVERAIKADNAKIFHIDDALETKEMEEIAKLAAKILSTKDEQEDTRIFYETSEDFAAF